MLTLTDTVLLTGNIFGVHIVVTLSMVIYLAIAAVIGLIAETIVGWRLPFGIIGAILAGLLWELAKHVFIFFVSNFLTSSNIIYGSLTTIIAFLTWSYLSMLIFLFGGHVNERYKRRRQDRSSPAIKM